MNGCILWLEVKRDNIRMTYIPQQGDIIWLDFDPSCGKEITKRRPAFVISQGTFNSFSKMVIVAPITSTIRGGKLEVLLPEGLSIKGAVLVYQLKSVDFIERNIKFIDKVPKSTLSQVLSIAQILVQ